jgi:hypothetical protein
VFLEALGGVDVAGLAPAVADWLRWRYQRLQIDTRNDVAWMEVRLTKLPARQERAGERLLVAAEAESSDTASHAIWRPKNAPNAAPSRRSFADRPRATKPVPIRNKACVGRPQSRPVDTDEQEALLELYRDHADVLRPIMQMTKGEAAQWAVLRTLRGYLDAPQDSGAHQRWIAFVQTTLVLPMASSAVG